jgi:hypothetical protein
MSTGENRKQCKKAKVLWLDFAKAKMKYSYNHTI